MPCGMTRRRVRNVSVDTTVQRLVDADTGAPIPRGSTGVVDPHDDGVLAGIAGGRLDDLGPAEAVTPEQERQYAAELAGAGHHHHQEDHR